MKVKFSFNEDVAEQRGYMPEDVRQTIKNMFAFYDLSCISDNVILAFKDKGHDDDFAVSAIISSSPSSQGKLLQS